MKAKDAVQKANNRERRFCLSIDVHCLKIRENQFGFGCWSDSGERIANDPGRKDKGFEAQW
jgi:hypothetical protein